MEDKGAAASDVEVTGGEGRGEMYEPTCYWTGVRSHKERLQQCCQDNIINKKCHQRRR